MARCLLLCLALMCLTIVSGQNVSTTTSEKNFTLVNTCKETIWVAIITKGDNFTGQSYILKSGQTAFHSEPMGWSGRIWARTGCNFNQNGTGSCQTGDCGSSLNCTGPSTPPNSIAEFTLGDVDFYDVSLVDGFNLPIVVKPLNGKGNCSTAGCDGDLRQNCLPDLAVKSNGKVIACRSACNKYDSDEYCCRGSFADPVACLPTNYSKSFKQICPAAASYALDGRTSIITCSAPDYIVGFCATRNQTLCSYQDNKVVCNTVTNWAKTTSIGWLILMLTIPLSFFFQFKF